MAGVLDHGVEHRALLALVGQEGVPGDDLGLLQHPEELRQQNRQGGCGNREQGREVPHPTRCRPAQRLQQPPGCQERHHHHPAGQMHREHAHEGEHRQRDPIAVGRGGGDQDEGRHG